MRVGRGDLARVVFRMLLVRLGQVVVGSRHKVRNVKSVQLAQPDRHVFID